MTTPANHHLIVTDRNGKQIHGKVVFVQAFALHSAEMHIVTSTWLAPYRYPARCSTPEQSETGFYAVLGYADADGQWLFKGVFESEQNRKL